MSNSRSKPAACWTLAATTSFVTRVSCHSMHVPRAARRLPHHGAGQGIIRLQSDRHAEDEDGVMVIATAQASDADVLARIRDGKLIETVDQMSGAYLEGIIRILTVS